MMNIQKELQQFSAGEADMRCRTGNNTGNHDK